MKADIISIGDELLIGQVTNTNASWMALQLNLLGIQVNRITNVADSKSEIISILNEASERSSIIMVTGGLGPTSDDITKPTICDFFNTTLVFNEKVFSMVDSFIKARGGKMNELNKGQAYLPKSCEVIFNTVGTAPAMWFEKDNKIFVFMPGVPFEMQKLMTDSVLPKIKEKFNPAKIFHKTILTHGIPESTLAERIADWEKILPSYIKLAYLPSPGIVKLRLSVYNKDDGQEIIEAQIAKLKSVLGNSIYGYDSDSLELVVGQLLLEKKKYLTLAESCTGGNISKLITSIPGSSEYYKGGVVAYSNEIKMSELQVEKKILESFGAVSQEVVESMATRVLSKFKANYAIAISGIAGPTGGTAQKPVGTVWIAVASEKEVTSKKYLFGDNRERNITRASLTALNMLRLILIGEK